MKKYPKEDIAVGWEPEKCVHTGNCCMGLPRVFRPEKRPWIKTEGATKQEIINQVAKCPSGALTIEKPD